MRPPDPGFRPRRPTAARRAGSRDGGVPLVIRSETGWNGPMADLAFDILAAARRLRKVAMEESHAEAVAGSLRNAVTGSVAASQDLPVTAVRGTAGSISPGSHGRRRRWVPLRRPHPERLPGRRSTSSAVLPRTIPAWARRTSCRQSARIAFTIPKAPGRLPTVAVRCGIGVPPSVAVGRTARGGSLSPPTHNLMRHPNDRAIVTRPAAR